VFAWRKQPHEFATPASSTGQGGGKGRYTEKGKVAYCDTGNRPTTRAHALKAPVCWLHNQPAISAAPHKGATSRGFQMPKGRQRQHKAQAAHGRRSRQRRHWCAGSTTSCGPREGECTGSRRVLTERPGIRVHLTGYLKGTLLLLFVNKLHSNFSPKIANVSQKRIFFWHLK